jgi:hypothetical protein
MPGGVLRRVTVVWWRVIATRSDHDRLVNIRVSGLGVVGWASACHTDSLLPLVFSGLVLQIINLLLHGSQQRFSGFLFAGSYSCEFDAIDEVAFPALFAVSGIRREAWLGLV